MRITWVRLRETVRIGGREVGPSFFAKDVAPAALSLCRDGLRIGTTLVPWANVRQVDEAPAKETKRP